MTLLPTSVPANFSQNETTGTPCQTEQWVYNAFPVYILVISGLGIVFNLFVLMVFCFHKKPCTVAEIYLSNLAAADLVLVSFLPFWAVAVLRGFTWPFGRALCRLVNLSINMNVYCSIYFLVLVSIDRYWAVVHPLSHEKIRRPKYAKLSCLLVWCLGLLLGVPTLVYRDVNVNNKNPNITTCGLKYKETYELLLFEGMPAIFGFLIPIPIISYCTWKIVRALNNRLTEVSSSQKMEHKATILILAVLLAFLVCWVPFHLVKIMELLLTVKVFGGCRLTIIIRISKQIFTYFAFFNSVLNPILYVIVGKTFQKKVRELFESSTSIRSTLTSSFNSTRIYRMRSVQCEDVSS